MGAKHITHPQRVRAYARLTRYADVIERKRLAVMSVQELMAEADILRKQLSNINTALIVATVGAGASYGEEARVR